MNRKQVLNLLYVMLDSKNLLIIVAVIVNGSLQSGNTHLITSGQRQHCGSCSFVVLCTAVCALRLVVIKTAKCET